MEKILISGVVHWIGAGLSSGRGLATVVKNAKKVILWNRSFSNAKKLLTRLNLNSQIIQKEFSNNSLDRELGVGDIVICMLPASLELEIVQLCLANNSHFVSSSYLSETVTKTVTNSLKKGLVVQFEAGLDPGIDHLLAHILVDECLKKYPDLNLTINFESFCGGFPAEKNDFCYKFSWAPASLLKALKAPAKHIADNKIIKTEKIWEAITSLKINNEELECYPNRNSLPYLEHYHIPKHWQVEKFIRGTIRLKGWKNAWKPIFEKLDDISEDNLKKLAQKLRTKYSYKENEYDRVLLSVSLQATYNKKIVWKKSLGLDIKGNQLDNAMAKIVSETVAAATCKIINQKTSAGLHIAAENSTDSKSWLQALEKANLKIISLN